MYDRWFKGNALFVYLGVYPPTYIRTHTIISSSPFFGTCHYFSGNFSCIYPTAPLSPSPSREQHHCIYLSCCVKRHEKNTKRELSIFPENFVQPNECEDRVDFVKTKGKLATSSKYMQYTKMVFFSGGSGGVFIWHLCSPPLFHIFTLFSSIR